MEKKKIILFRIITSPGSMRQVFLEAAVSLTCGSSYQKISTWYKRIEILCCKSGAIKGF